MATTQDSRSKERDYVQYLDRLEEEAIIRQDEGPLREAATNMRFFRGDQWPVESGPGSPFRADAASYRFTVNMMGQLVKRKTALITDSRPVIDIVSRKGGAKRTAKTFEQVSQAIWDENNFDMLAARELVRACTIGSTVCIPTWNPNANFGAGMVELLTYDPRSLRIDPGITKAIDIQSKAEFVQLREVVALNYVRENYPTKGPQVSPSSAWSSYVRSPVSARQVSGGIRSPQAPSPGQTPWRRRRDETTDSASPRVELRHSWVRDWVRDDRGEPVWSLPRIIRYSADAEGVVLKDERLVYRHGQIPTHLFDWDVELEHPWGIPEVGGLRRINWTLNRLFGQVMDNVLATNRTRVVADSDAVDAKTWQMISANPNGIYIRKRAGRQLNYEVPQGAVPAYIPQVINMLMGAIDTVSGMTEVMRGQTKQGGATSAVAIDSLQLAAQSIIRMEARAFENWLQRIFQQVIALVWQYYTNNRLLHVVGPGSDLLEFVFNRTQFIRDDGDRLMNVDTAWQDFVFRVMPGSSLAMTRVQKGVMAANLYQMGLVPGAYVLEAAEVPNAAELVTEARKEQQEGHGPGARASRKMQKFPGASKRSPGPVGAPS